MASLARGRGLNAGPLTGGCSRAKQRKRRVERAAWSSSKSPLAFARPLQPPISHFWGRPSWPPQRHLPSSQHLLLHHCWCSSCAGHHRAGRVVPRAAHHHHLDAGPRPLPPPAGGTPHLHGPHQRCRPGAGVAIAAQAGARRAQARGAPHHGSQPAPAGSAQGAAGAACALGASGCGRGRQRGGGAAGSVGRGLPKRRVHGAARPDGGQGPAHR